MIRGKTNEMGRLFEAGFESYRAFVEAAVAVQQQNARLALDAFGRSVGMLAGGTAANRALLKQARAQQEALLSLAEQSLGARAGSPRGQDPEGEADLPISDYDRLEVRELGRRLRGLCARDVERLKAHERRTRNRPAVMERLDRSLV